MPKKNYKKSVDKKQSKDIKFLKQMVGTTEIKVNQAHSVTTLTATQTTLNWRDVGEVKQGDNYYERTGSRITPIEAVIRWVFNNSSETIAYECRAILVRLRSYSSAAVPSDAAMLFTPSYPSSLLNYGASISYRRGKYHQASQVDILYDSGLIYLNARGQNSGAVYSPGSHWTKTINLRKKLDPRKVIHYAGTAATDGDVNDIFWITWSSNTNIVEAGSTALVFTDA